MKNFTPLSHKAEGGTIIEGALYEDGHLKVSTVVIPREGFLEVIWLTPGNYKGYFQELQAAFQPTIDRVREDWAEHIRRRQGFQMGAM